MRIAIVDLGTNSVRFAIYELGVRRQIRVLYKEKIMLQPGKGVFTKGLLRPATLRSLVQVFGDFRVQADGFKVDRFKAFATCALREARNRQQLVSKVRKLYGIRIEIISGAREAELIAAGILKHERHLPSRLALVDIGGGSTEISLILKKKLVYKASFPLGAERLAQLFPLYDGHGQLRKKQLTRLRLAVRANLKINARQVQKVEPGLAIGTSGTIRALARLLRRRPRGMKRAAFSQARLEALCLRMQHRSLGELKRVPFLESKRAPQILGGAILLDEVLTQFQVTRVEVSERSLRDGILADWLKSHPKSK